MVRVTFRVGRVRAMALVVALSASGCARGEALDELVPARSVGLSPTTTESRPTTTEPRPSTTEPRPPTTEPRPTTTVLPAFAAQVAVIDDALSARMSASWRPGCPVALSSLRHVALTHWGMDGAVHDGELVLHAEVVEPVMSVFAELFAARFPIERMRLVDDYGGDDLASMRANNTSAFNCREVAGRPGVLSSHSWGTAIDINPLVNPWVSSRFVDPPEGVPYVDRSRRVAGGIYRGDVVTSAFARIGWGWGGDWPSSKDWQHFSAAGN